MRWLSTIVLSVALPAMADEVDPVERVFALTDDLLEALVEAPPQASHAFFTPWLADGVPLADWQAMRAGQTQQFGPLRSLEAHFTGQREDGDIQVLVRGHYGENPRDMVCGVMVWDEPQSESVGIRLIYLNFLPEARTALIPEADLRRIEISAGCPEGLLSN